MSDTEPRISECFDCPECGTFAEVNSNQEAPYYEDGDELTCSNCGLKGQVICDEEGARDLWDW